MKMGMNKGGIKCFLVCVMCLVCGLAGLASEVQAVDRGNTSATGSDCDAAASGAGTSSGGVAPELVGIIVASAVTGGSGFLLGKSRAVRIDNQPLHVALADKFATKEDLDGLEKRQAAFEKDMRQLLRDSEHRSHGRMDTICTKLDHLIGLVQGMHGAAMPQIRNTKD